MLKKRVLINNQAIHAAGMLSQQERFEAMMKVKQEDHNSNMETIKGKHKLLTTMVEELEENLHRKYEEAEGLQKIIEEKQTMDAAKAAADMFCHKQVEDAHETQKVQEIFEVNRWEMHMRPRKCKRPSR